MLVKIKNYQAHQDSMLEFDEPGINVIVGPSDSGKSSVVRAIASLVDGSPIDRRHGSKETVVEVDGCRRVRGNTKNQFEIGDRVYKAMRSEAPREIKEALNLDAINFRSQHQPYFLLADSPGATARAMNELADLGMIDYVQTELKKLAKSAGDQVARVDREIQNHNTEIVALAWADQAERDWKAISSLRATGEESGLKADRLEDKVIELNDLQYRLTTFPAYQASDVDQLLSRFEDGSKAESIDALVADVDSATTWLITVPPVLASDRLKVSDHIRAIVDSEPLQRLVEEGLEYEADLTLVPDTAADLQTLTEAMNITVDGWVFQLIADLESLPPRDNFSGKKCLQQLGEIEAEVVEAVRVQGQEWLLSSHRSQAVLLAADIENLAGELDWARRQFDEALKAAGVCPLCGRHTV